jgi:hypothetical protein
MEFASYAKLKDNWKAHRLGVSEIEPTASFLDCMNLCGYFYRSF